MAVDQNFLKAKYPLLEFSIKSQKRTDGFFHLIEFFDQVKSLKKFGQLIMKVLINWKNTISIKWISVKRPPVWNLTMGKFWLEKVFEQRCYNLWIWCKSVYLSVCVYVCVSVCGGEWVLVCEWLCVNGWVWVSVSVCGQTVNRAECDDESTQLFSWSNITDDVHE